MSSNNSAEDKAYLRRSVDYLGATAFILVHLACFAVIFTGVTKTSVILAISLYLIRIWAVSAGYHRYFSHKTFKTSRIFQFILGFLAQTTTQKGILWWSNHHRHHHINSDTAKDVHSPRRQGFWYAHMGWIFDPLHSHKNYTMVNDWKKYPELVLLDKYETTPAIILAVICFLIDGWAGLVVGFFMSTVFLYHITFTINSLSHIFGRQRFLTADDSRNNWFLAIFTFGEGWHNNHHYYQMSARQGFRWWEYDFTYYILLLLQKIGIIWDIHEPPETVRTGQHHVPKKIVNMTRSIFEEANFNLESLSIDLYGISTAFKNFIGQSSDYIDQINEEISVSLDRLQNKFNESVKCLENFPPNLAKAVKEKFNHAAEVVEQAKAAMRSKTRYEEIAKLLESTARSIEFRQFIPTGGVANS